jgi:uncharacterized protein (DUF58 family)
MHISAEIYAQIRHVELYTRSILSGILIGDSRSRMRGTGFEFDQLREYQIGDDFRTIDWRSSARMQTTLVKQYKEERSRIIMIGVDVSKSMTYGIDEKYNTSAWIASIIALIGAYGSDRVGLILYSDVVEQYIPPRTGLSHARGLMSSLFGHVPTKQKTNVAIALKHLHTIKESAFVCMISDFIDENLRDGLARCARKHELVALRHLDTGERALPAARFVMTMSDAEIGGSGSVNLSPHSVNGIHSALHTRLESQNRIFKQYGVPFLDIVSHKKFIQKFVKLLRPRLY